MKFFFDTTTNKDGQGFHVVLARSNGIITVVAKHETYLKGEIHAFASVEQSKEETRIILAVAMREKMGINGLKFSFCHSPTWTFLEGNTSTSVFHPNTTVSYLFKTFVQQSNFGFGKFCQADHFFKTFRYFSFFHR